MAAQKPEKKFDPIELSVSDFIIREFAKFDIACGNGHTLIMVLKECTIAQWDRQQDDYANTIESIAGGKSSGFSSKQEMNQIMGLFADFGAKIPVIMMRGLELHIIYNGEVYLEFANPKFFDQLAETIAYVATHDTVPGGSVKPLRRPPPIY